MLVACQRTNRIAIAELEGYGLPVRAINMLEDELGMIWLDELLELTPDELMAVPCIGRTTSVQVIRAVRRRLDPRSAQ